MNFIIPIVPVAQQRARSHAFINKVGKAQAMRPYKSDRQVEEENKLIALLVQYRPPRPLEGSLTLGVRAYLPIAASWPKKHKEAAIIGQLRPGKKPDLDNLMKHLMDCLTSLHFWLDDKQVVEYLPGTGKYYDDGNGPRWEITLEHI